MEHKKCSKPPTSSESSQLLGKINKNVWDHHPVLDIFHSKPAFSGHISGHPGGVPVAGTGPLHLRPSGLKTRPIHLRYVLNRFNAFRNQKKEQLETWKICLETRWIIFWGLASVCVCITLTTENHPFISISVVTVNPWGCPEKHCLSVFYIPIVLCVDCLFIYFVLMIRACFFICWPSYYIWHVLSPIYI